MSLRTTLLTASALTALIAAPALAQSTADATTEVIVTGSRGKPRTVTSSPAPIDIIGADQISKLAGSMQLRDVLTQLVPSYQAMAVGSSSQDSIVRPAGLRGMSGVHVLVLVNGQRRHNSSLINLNSGNVSAGANPVDIDLIPASAIDHIEILRDGAAAQYGSDAIAGVINIILKSNRSGSSGSVEFGQRFEGDGTTISAQASQGFALPHDGSTTVSLAVKTTDKVVRNSDVTGTMYDTVGGLPDPREASANRRTYQGGLPEVHSLDLVTNTVIPLKDDAQFYATTTFTTRNGRAGQAGRKPNANSNITATYPNGFTPYYTMKEYDFQVSAGIKGAFMGWDSNLGTTFGRDHVINGADNSINASLGAVSPTSFETYSSQFDQWTTNLDLTRHFDVFGGKALQVSTGAEFRHENYQTHALDEEAYINGGYYYTSGTNKGKPALTGAQGAIIVLPGDEADISRNVTAAYVDLALDVTPKWLVTAAARFETYDDSAGDVVSGKVSTRYKVNDWLTLRGAASTGFRAPSLAQMGYAQTGTQFNLVGTTYQLIESKIVKTDSAVGVALGAQPLKPEKSRNYSAGFALTPGHGFTLTLDAYQIELDDRIQLTGLLSSAGVKAILIANGFSGNQYVRYFTNAIDTTTRGVDLVATYNLSTERFGRFRTTLGYNHNETEIDKIAPTPDALAGLGLTLFDRQTQGYITELQPKDKVILGLDWSAGPYAVNIKESRYGEFNLLGATAATDQSFGAKFITDLEISRAFGEGYRIAIGAYNLLDVYPDKNTIANTIGSSPYAAYSPFGGYGGYYYARLSWKM